MGKRSITILTLSFVSAFVMSNVATDFAYATTVVNSINVHSTTGGQVVVGQNGADGKKGQDGKDGRDGMNGSNGEDGVNVVSSSASSSISVKSVINGVTVFESKTVPTEDLGVPLLQEEKFATSVDNFDSSVHVTAEAEAGTMSPASNYERIQEIFTAIQLILTTYVSKLF